MDSIDYTDLPNLILRASPTLKIEASYVEMTRMQPLSEEYVRGEPTWCWRSPAARQQ